MIFFFCVKIRARRGYVFFFYNIKKRSYGMKPHIVPLSRSSGICDEASVHCIEVPSCIEAVHTWSGRDDLLREQTIYRSERDSEIQRQTLVVPQVGITAESERRLVEQFIAHELANTESPPSERRTIRGFVTHRRADADELFALYFFRVAGSTHFDMQCDFSESSIQFLPREDGDPRTWQELRADGIEALGIKGGPFDEHVQEAHVQCHYLVAQALGLERSVIVQPFLRSRTQALYELKKTLQATVMGCRRNGRPDFEIFQMVCYTLDNHFAQRVHLVREVSPAIERMQIRSIRNTGLKLGVVFLPDLSFDHAGLALKRSKCDVVISKTRHGNMAMIFRGSSFPRESWRREMLDDLVQVVRIKEAIARGRSVPSPQDLSKKGFSASCPEWLFRDSQNPKLLNGAATWLEAPPTAISLKAMCELIETTFDACRRRKEEALCVGSRLGPMKAHTTRTRMNI